MLKINKILSKKIKSPLSLLGEERQSNLSGFSLIELMIAITILAVAIFGIFNAYSTGFMGIADARDRTVATNYLREAIEDFKNMDFNQVKSKPITPIPDTKFSRGTYVLNLEGIDGVVTLKKVITQVRWIDRKGNIKTEKASTIIYNKPATSEEGDEAIELVLYAKSYYTILPEHIINLIAEIKDENGNIYDWDGPINFLVITDPANTPPVGSITTLQPVNAINGIANCTFTAISGENVEGIERIQAAATVNGNDLNDTVNIRVTTGPVGIVIVPASEEDRVKAAGAGVTSNIKLYVVKADYDYEDNPITYDKPITLSAVGQGTLSETTIDSVPTEGTSFSLTSNGTPGVVEITASAPDLDIGYTEITFTGEPSSILVEAEKNSVYPGEDITVKVTIVDINNIPVGYNGTVDLTALPAYGSFNNDSLSFTGQSSLDTTVFTVDPDTPPGETIMLQANNGSISGSTEITILSTLTPYYLNLFAFPLSVDLSEEFSRTITATIYDDNGTEIVTTYNTPINFISKKGEISFGSFLPSSSEIPITGEVEVELYSDIAGTTIVTASSGDLILTPQGGIEIVFYETAHHIVLSADPDTIEADGNETSIIAATVCDEYGNRVANYGQNGDKSITFTADIGGFPENNDLNTIISTFFDEGEVTVSFSSSEPGTGTAIVTAQSSDYPLVSDGSVSIALTGDIPSVLTLGDITNWDDYLISFDITVTGAPIYLDEIKIEWDNSAAPLDQIIIKSPDTEEGLSISTVTSDSPSTLVEVGKTLIKDVTSNIGLSFRNGVSKMKQKNIIVTFTEEDGTIYAVSFRVPNM